MTPLLSQVNTSTSAELTEDIKSNMTVQGDELCDGSAIQLAQIQQTILDKRQNESQHSTLNYTKGMLFFGFRTIHNQK